MSRARAALAVFCVCFLPAASTALAEGVYGVPEGGWLYTYEANAGEDIAGAPDSGFTSLDGTWSHDNGSDAWDGSKFGDDGAPGGVEVIDGSFVRIQDPGDPRDHGFGGDPSNRKIYLGHDLSANGASASLLDDGVTLYFRMRLAPAGDDLRPDGGGDALPYPAGGDGYLTHDGGKGTIGLKQAAGGLISFVLVDTADGGPAILTNNLNGTAITGDVDFGEAGDLLALPLDVSEWHDYWITISKPEGGGAGTHQLALYLDGAVDPIVSEVDLTAGSGSDFSDITYLAIGQGSTGQSGAFDLDFVRVASGLHAPALAPKPVPAISLWGLLLMGVLFALACGLAWSRRRPLTESA